MKKPTKPPPSPPPPPPPPKQGIVSLSPLCSVASIPRQNYCWNGSEYAESVSSISYSTRSLQPPMRCGSPLTYQTCRSESGFRVGSTLGSSSYRTCCSSIQPSQNCCCHGISCLSNSTRGCGIASLVSEQQRTVSPCGTVHSHQSHFSATNNCGHASYSPQVSSCCEYETCSSHPSPSAKLFLQHHNNSHAGHNHLNLMPEHQALSESSRGVNDNLAAPPPHRYAPHDNRIKRVDVFDGPGSSENQDKQPPIPKERIIRPRMSISPLPKLKRARDPNVKESFKKCKPSQYKRHMDLHVQTIFKYLSDRENRRINLEAKLSMNERNDELLRDIEKMSFRKRESDYLRSLRSRISVGDFIKIGDLGQGYMGSVSLVEKRSLNGEESDLFAMKKIKKSQVYQQNHMAHVMAERDILAEADDDWIVKLYYSFQDEQNLYFILEYLPGGDMIGLLMKEEVFPEEWAQFFIAEIALAVQFVHDMGYIHRDIKPDNILIDANGHIKLTDFGLCTGFRWTHDSKYYNDDTVGTTFNHSRLNSIQSGENRSDEHMTITRELIKREIEHSRKPKILSVVGSPNYIAPEVLRLAEDLHQADVFRKAGDLHQAEVIRQAGFYRQQSTNEKLCDWWSVGVILYEMVVGYCPFIDLEDPEGNEPEFIQSRILDWKQNLKFRQLYNDKNEPRQLSIEVVSLIRGLICDPEDRLCQNGIGDLQGHPFFAGLDWVNIRSCEAPWKPNLNNKYDTSNFPKDDPLPQPSFTSSKSHGTVAHFTYKNFYMK